MDKPKKKMDNIIITLKFMPNEKVYHILYKGISVLNQKYLYCLPLSHKSYMMFLVHHQQNIL
ncbi:hypothetical protein DU508_09200 [Pedobacter chinensis]|uniref:Uncharacterized protein n=1 Tax=Pedobacter chinensis TaxID=2282421 RepID=A0A369PXI5_9SPHI|nr:hypothetical protein [Pedobacter chinensis]RDC57333.1 hypothetical protein DU508_09200 [Pedobacter chinensis]